MLFENALQDMRIGSFVTRDSWNNGRWLYMYNGNIHNEFSVVWTPKQEDIVADDWLIDLSE